MRSEKQYENFVLHIERMHMEPGGNGISKTTQKRGYLCLESEGAEIHFRNIRILELPPGASTDPPK